MSTLLLLLSSLCHQAEGVIVKKYNEKHADGNFIFTAFFAFFSMLFFVITHNGGYNFSWQIVPYALAAGALYSGSSFLCFVAYGCGSFVLSKLVLSYSIVITIGYGLIFLKEPVSVFAYIGLIIMIISIYLSNGKNRGGVKFSLKWFVCIMLSAIGSGMFGVIQRMQQIKFNNSATNEFMIITLGFAFISFLIIGLILDGKNIGRIFKSGVPYAALAGISNGATNFLMLYVFTMIPISIASPSNAGIEIIISFILSKLMFKEVFTKSQVVSVMLGVVAVVLLNI